MPDLRRNHRRVTSKFLPSCQGGKGPELGRLDGKGGSAVTDKWPVSQPNHATQTGHTGPCPGETSRLSPEGSRPGPTLPARPRASTAAKAEKGLSG